MEKGQSRTTLETCYYKRSNAAPGIACATAPDAGVGYDDTAGVEHGDAPIDGVGCFGDVAGRQEANVDCESFKILLDNVIDHCFPSQVTFTFALCSTLFFLVIFTYILVISYYLF